MSGNEKRNHPLENANMFGKPEFEINVTKALIRSLLNEQHADFGELELSFVKSGWDNTVFRLGKNHAVRLPIRASAEPLILHEQKWLPQISERLAIPTPVHVRAGCPNDNFPWHWSIVPWIEGTTADRVFPLSSQAKVLADFLLALHQPAPENAPINELRGVPLEQRKQTGEERMSRIQLNNRARAVWNKGLEASVSTDRCWLHGDLHSQNVLVKDGKICAILDWGDMTCGDVATDLAAVWSLFEHQKDRERVLELYNPSQAAFERARAWTVFFAALLIDSGTVNSPEHLDLGRRLLRRVMADS